MNDDLISRQAAIAYAISGRTREFEGEKWIRVSEIRESLKTMPTAEPDMARAISTIIENEQDMRVIKRNASPRWIPVTERLPEENKPVLVTHHGKHQAFVSVDWIDPHTHEWNRTCNVTAWQLLPEPWKGEDDEKR